MNPTGESAVLDEAYLARGFDRAAATFDAADFVHSVTRDGLIARLAPMTIDAQTVIDLGCATGAAIKPLASRFRGALVVGCDRSALMLAAASRRRTWFSRPALIRADARRLPFADHGVDVVFANLLLPWIAEPTSLFAEISRILRKDGVFVFATLGPDSLSQLRDAWAGVDTRPHVHDFTDMHDLGDAAVAAGLRDPVLDVDRIAITYTSASALFDDLRRAGARNGIATRRRTLLGKRRLGRVVETLEAGCVDGRFPVDLEIVYGHCWGSGVRPGRGEIAVDATHIGRRGSPQ